VSKTIQIRNVPEGLHRKLKSRAALEGFSLSGYLLKEIEQVVRRPTLQESTRASCWQDPSEV
jgi:plasmid stability protein